MIPNTVESGQKRANHTQERKINSGELHFKTLVERSYMQITSSLQRFDVEHSTRHSASE